jgi:hypothetical protein
VEEETRAEKVARYRAAAKRKYPYGCAPDLLCIVLTMAVLHFEWRQALLFSMFTSAVFHEVLDELRQGRK